MAEYDLQSPYDLAIMHSEFDMFSADDWEEYIELAEEFKMSYKNVNCLKAAQRKAGIAKYFNNKMIRWSLSLVEQIDEKLAEEEEAEGK